VDNAEKQIEEYQNILSGCIARNLPLIMALQLEIEDVKQDLYVRLLKAIGRFDTDRCRSMPMYLKHELQYEILDIRRRHKPHGMVGVPKDKRLDTISLDHESEDGAFFELPTHDEYNLISHDIAELLHDDEYSVLNRIISGERLYKKAELTLLEKARTKLTDYFPERMCRYAEAAV